MTKFWTSRHFGLNPCFEKTVLLWIPCLVSIVAILFHFSCQNRTERKLKLLRWCSFCLCKLVSFIRVFLNYLWSFLYGPYFQMCMVSLLLFSLARLVATVVQEFLAFGFADKLEGFSLAFVAAIVVKSVYYSKINF